MKTPLKIFTAITSFFPAAFFAFCFIMSLTNMFMNIKAATEPMPNVEGTVSPSDRMVILSIIFAMLPIIIIALFCAFNMIFDIVYIVRSERFSGNQMILWILLTALLIVISAPVFWCIYIRTADKNSPMFPPRQY